MIHPIYRATFCRALSAYKLELHFNDGESRIVDLEPVLAGALYGPLRDQAVFSQVRLDEAVSYTHLTLPTNREV